MVSSSGEQEAGDGPPHPQRAGARRLARRAGVGRLDPSSSLEDLPQLGGRGFLELIVAAFRRRLVWPPAQEGRRVAKAISLQVIVSDFADALDAQRLPAQVLALVPARRGAGHALVPCPVCPFAPGMVLRRSFAQRRQLLDQLAPPLRREGRRHADVLEPDALVVETEQKRSHHRPGPILVPAKTRHDAVCGAGMLDLDHRALVGLVGLVETLGHHAVEARSFEARKPVLRDCAIARRGREEDGRPDLAERALEPLAPLFLGSSAEIVLAFEEKIEGDERGWRLLGEQLDARRRRMDAQEQRIEVEPVLGGDDDLPVEHAARRRLLAERREQLGEVPVERFFLARLQNHFRAVAEDEGAEAVPLRLVEPAAALGQRRGELRQHWLDGWPQHGPQHLTPPARVDARAGRAYERRRRRRRWQARASRSRSYSSSSARSTRKSSAARARNRPCSAAIWARCSSSWASSPRRFSCAPARSSWVFPRSSSTSRRSPPRWCARSPSISARSTASYP